MGVEFSQTKQMLFSYIPKLYGLNPLLTSLKTKLNQDENAGTLREHFLEKNCILLLFSFRLMFECLNIAIPSRKYFTKAHAKRRNYVFHNYVFNLKTNLC